MENSKDQDYQGTNLWLAVKRNWLIVLIVGLAVFSFPAYKVLTKKKIFQSTAIILVNNQNAVPISGENTPTASNQNAELGNDLSTEIEILKSPALLTRALKTLSLSDQSIEAAQITLGLSLQPNPKTRILVVSYANENPRLAHEVLKALVKTYIDYSRESLRSPVSNSIRFIEVQLPEARQNLQNASANLTKFRKTYNLDALDTSAATALSNRENLQTQITAASVEVAKTRQLIQQLQQQAPDVNLNVNSLVSDAVLSQDTTYQNLLTQLRTLDAQYALEQTRLQPLHPMLTALKEQREETHRLLQMQVQRVIGNRQSHAASNTTVSGAIQQNVSTQLLTAQSNLAVQTTQLKSLRQAEVQASKKLQQILSLQQTYRELERQYNLNSKTVDTLLGKLQEFKIREAQDTNSWKILEPPDFPHVPLPSNSMRELMMGLVQGLIAGAAVAFLLEKFDRRLKGIQEIKDLTGLPILGSLPKVSPRELAPWGHQINEWSNANGLLVESARSIAMALQFQQSLGLGQQKGKIFVVTSAEIGEGKTTVTQHLGITLAELGRKVLIVDANLNDPSLHKRFGIANQQGLITAISTSHSWKDFIQPIVHQQRDAITTPNRSENGYHLQRPSWTQPEKQLDFFTGGYSAALMSEAQDLTENHLANTTHLEATGSPLDVLPSGPISKQPVIWLASPKMPQLLEQWRHDYDCILIDTPSMNALTDVQCVVPYVDSVILTVGVKCATRQVLTRTLETLRTIETNIVGIVVNFCPQAEVLS